MSLLYGKMYSACQIVFIHLLVASISNCSLSLDVLLFINNQQYMNDKKIFRIGKYNILNNILNNE